MASRSLSRGRTTSRFNLISARGRQALIQAGYEYLMVTTPVGVYVGLESYHHHDVTFIWKSPEWAIAVVFLLFQGSSLYRRNLRKAGRSLAEGLFDVFTIVAVVLTIVAVLNVLSSFEGNSTGTILFRAITFALVSAGFVLLVGGSTLLTLEEDR